MDSFPFFVTADGSHTIISDQFGEKYHSRHGAIQESQHVFIDAGFHAVQKDSIKILELGFGTGLNALLTLKATTENSATVKYISIEAYPISLAQAKLLNYPKLVTINNGDQLFFQLHSCTWEQVVNISPSFHFSKFHARIQDIEFNDKFDLIYFDAFAPATQPELWEPIILTKMYNLLEPGGILVTYCAKGVFKRTLKSVGFKVEALPGPPGKREMTRATK